MDRYAAGIVALLCCTVLLVGGIVVADASYEIEIAGSVDTPDDEVTIEGEEYTVSAIGVADPGEPIDVSVDAPDNVSFDVYLYNEDRQTVDRVYDADSTVTFDGEYSAGSYLVAVWVDGSVETVHPVVVRSYDVSVDAPDEVEPGSDVEFTVDVENVQGTPENLDSVQVVVSKDGDNEVVTASESADGEYTATMTLSETGEYLVYANVRGSETANGQKELMGVSRSTTVQVRETTPTATATSTDSSGGGSNSSTDTVTATQSATVTATTTPTATATATSTATPTSTATSTATATATDLPASPTPTTDDVLTPNPNTSTTTGGLSVLIPVGSLVTFGLLVWRRH